MDRFFQIYGSFQPGGRLSQMVTERYPAVVAQNRYYCYCTSCGFKATYIYMLVLLQSQHYNNHNITAIATLLQLRHSCNHNILYAPSDPYLCVSELPVNGGSCVKL